jgi:competence protein ComEC
MRLAFWSAALAAGIAGGIALGPTPAKVLVLLAGGASLAFVGLRGWTLGLGSLAVLLGLVLGRREVDRAREPSRVVEDQWVDVVGEVRQGSDVAEAPAAGALGSAGGVDAPPGSHRSHLRVAIERVDGRPLAASLSLLVLDGVPALAPGDHIRFSSRLYVPRGFANPGLPDARLLARAQGIDLLATVRSPADLQRLSTPISLWCYPRRWAFHLRQALGRAINQRLTEPVAGFVRTMALGERSDVPTEIEDGFRAAGATHVLSVSGLHLAVVVFLFFQAMKRLLARFPAWALRIPPKVLASTLALPATAFYTMLTGEAVATVRSALMASVVLGAAVANRPLSLAASIGFSALVLLGRTPAALLDVSFQLSFASVIGLGLFAGWLLPAVATPPRSGLGRILGWLRRSLSASLAACLVTLPIVAHHFGQITPAAPLGNLLLVPVVELAVLPCGLVGGLLALVHPWLGAIPLVIAGFASRLALGLAEEFRVFAPVLLVRFPNTTETLLFVAAVGGLLRGVMVGPGRRRRWLQLAFLGAALAVVSLCGREFQRRTREDLRVTFLDVGQGDAILIEGPRGWTALVDGGGRYDGSFDTGARIVEPVLRAAGIPRLDLMVLSHPHPDHMNGLLRILERFPVGALWTSGDDGHNPIYARLIALARERGVPLAEPDALSSAGLRVEPIGPWLDGHIAAPPGLGTNDASMVVRLTFGGRRILLTGDIGEEGEAELLDRRAAGLALAADALKMPHHGSRHASTEPFIDAVSPRIAVASAGRFNRFGLPSPAALARYARRRILVLRTDRDGAVRLTVDRLGEMKTQCWRGCDASPDAAAPGLGISSPSRASAARPRPLR